MHLAKILLVSGILIFAPCQCKKLDNKSEG